MKKIYFLSDAHLGSWAIEHSRTHERRLVSFLDKIKDEAAAVYMLGDMFDFWYEHRYVVPKGFTRFLGKVSELTDRSFRSRSSHFLTTSPRRQPPSGVSLVRSSPRPQNWPKRWSRPLP